MRIFELFRDLDSVCHWLSSWEDAKLFGDRGYLSQNGLALLPTTI